MPAAMRFGRIEVQPEQRQVLVDGRPVTIAARAYDVLWTLIEHRDRVITKSELLDLVWPGVVVEEHNLHTQVSLLRKVVGAKAIATIPGRGYRFVAVLDSDASRPAAGTGRSEATSANGPSTEVSAGFPVLWGPRTRLIGREAELEDCTNLLGQVRLLTLTGMGGCGKTRLAHRLSELAAETFPDGAWFVDLSPLQDVDRVASVVCTTMGIAEAQGQPLSARLVGNFLDRQALLVLDNCEHVIGSVRKFVDTLLSACPLMKVLTTSREPLGLQGEQVVSVKTLPVPMGTDLGSAERSEAVQLFVDRARLAFPGFALDIRNAIAVGDLCRRLDGLPLAIELAAARVRMLSVEDIVARLNDRFRLLTSGGSESKRHDTLLSVLEWSYASLAAAEQALFRRLSVFAGGFTLAAATKVATLGDEYVTLDVLTHLHDKSLIEVDRSGSEQPRYRMLETVHCFARDRLDASGETQLTRDRHLAFQVELVQTAAREIDGSLQGMWISKLRREQENLLTACDWSLFESRAPEAALRLAASTWRYWMLSSQTESGYRLASLALQGVRGDAASLIHCRALRAAGYLANATGRYQEAMEWAEKGVQMAESLGDACEMASALARRGGAHHALGHLAQAREQFEVACEAARQLPTPSVLGNALNGLAEVHRAMGSLILARSCYQESIAIARDLENPTGVIVPLCNLARVLIRTRDFNGARHLLVEGFDLRIAEGLDGVDDQLLEVAAALAISAGGFFHGVALYGAAVRLVQEAGSHREPVDEALIAPLVEKAQIALGDDSFAVASGSQVGLSRDELVRRARDWVRESR